MPDATRECDRCHQEVNAMPVDGLCDTCQMNTALLSIAESLKALAATVEIWREAEQQKGGY